MIKKLLTPIDGSDDANVALDVAADIAAKYGAHIKLLHVGLRQAGPRTRLLEAAERSFDQAQSSGGWTSDHQNWPRHLQVLDHMGHMILDAGEARARDRGATSIETVIDWGEEGERILHHAKHPTVDMIVMGSRGASPLQGLFLGSVSHKVFCLSPCTCATVHAAEGQSGLGKLERILVPFDGSDHAMKAVELASDMAKKFGAGIKFIHVLEPRHSPKHLSEAVEADRLDPETRQALDEACTPGRVAVGSVFPISMIPEAALRKIGEAILERSKAVAASRGIPDVQTELLDGDPADCILKVLERDRCDLIAMGMRGLGEVTGMLVGSVSYKVNHIATCTCITVK